MEQIYETILSCPDMESLDRIMTEEWEAMLLDDYDVTFTPGQPATITSTWTTPIGVIKQMSRENPDLTLTAALTCKTEEHPITHVLEFVNGEGGEVYQRPNYSVEFYAPSQYIGNPFNILMKQALDIFSRVDLSRGEEGILLVDPIPQPIQVVVEDEEYQIKILKRGFKVTVAECLKRRPGTAGKWTTVEKELKASFSI